MKITKREGLLRLHPDKFKSEDEKVKKEKEEECKKFIKSASAILEYLVEKGLKGIQNKEEDEVDVEEILRENNITPAEFVDFKKSKSKVIYFPLFLCRINAYI